MSIPIKFLRKEHWPPGLKRKERISLEAKCFKLNSSIAEQNQESDSRWNHHLIIGFVSFNAPLRSPISDANLGFYNWSIFNKSRFFFIFLLIMEFEQIQWLGQSNGGLSTFKWSKFAPKEEKHWFGNSPDFLERTKLQRTLSAFQNRFLDSSIPQFKQFVVWKSESPS